MIIVQKDTNICPTCGKEFKSVTGMKWHHSYVHGESIAGVLKTCIECGKEYRVVKAESKTSKYCSRECQGKYRSKNYKGENHPNYNQIKINCDFCGKEYTDIPSNIEKYEHHYCSQKCYHEACKVHENKVCENCGKIFYSSTSRRYCSRECYLEGNKVKKVCVGCGVDFEVPKSNADRYNYCSFNCKKEHSIGEHRICKRCGSEFYVKPNEIIKGINRQYCSKDCQYPPQYINCDNCGKKFRAKPNEIERGRRFCSKECAMKYTDETSIEKKLRKTLDKLNISYEQEYSLLTYFIDFALKDEKIAIEADGDYWHSLEKVKKRDIKRDKELSDLGWKIIRIKGSVIRNHENLDDLLNSKIQKALTAQEGAVFSYNR